MRREFDLSTADLPVITPEYDSPRLFSDAKEAVAELRRIYDTGTGFLRQRFDAMMAGQGEQADAPEADKPE